MIRRALALAVFLSLAGAVIAGTWWRALDDALTRLEERGRADLALAGDRLLGQLQRYREMTVLMADHPEILRFALDPSAPAEPVDALLRRTADMTRSDEFLLVGASGRIIASSGPGRGANRSTAPYVRRAMQGALGFHHEIEKETGRRLFVYAAPVFSPDGPVAGALVVRIETEAVEVIWRGEPMIVFFTDSDGIAFVSNRDELVLVRLDLMPEGEGEVPADLLRRKVRHIDRHEVWDLDGGPYLPARALHLTRPLPVIEMTGEALVDIAPAERQALLQALVAAAACLVIGAGGYALLERRRALAVQLAAEAEANARLETRVEERTRELSEANEQLHRAQAELVQAGKLSALGQMSAGISHELNQPLMAIRSYAENAGLFLDRAQPEKAAENLGRINDLARRMGRIIKNLRAFARQEHDGMSDVDLVQVVADALELSEARLRASGVGVDWQPPAAAVWVRGGEVRLQQVVMNLLANAADAMEAGGTVSINIAPVAGRVRLAVADTGPGIAEPDRIFDPFYSTKEVGASEGMGLGLSISYGIVQSFGGTIAGRNRDTGGAEFVVELDAAEPGTKAA
ncbi:ATP-binding protein [Defluviimonas sp. WL0024]|uniref:histidine kinase n=1 Tax=Albidovulum salinarum TaxID=2984153 RepID=A0ABT2X5B5_9RHOB|nr:ATP-binding protein [Defluviimonas sp. WL0024]MCU9847015.1 ATP-binding protein [Defluviimonas sp. WL0024]